MATGQKDTAPEADQDHTEARAPLAAGMRRVSYGAMVQAFNALQWFDQQELRSALDALHIAEALEPAVEALKAKGDTYNRALRAVQLKNAARDDANQPQRDPQGAVQIDPDKQGRFDTELANLQAETFDVRDVVLPFETLALAAPPVTVWRALRLAFTIGMPAAPEAPASA